MRRSQENGTFTQNRQTDTHDGRRSFLYQIKKNKSHEKMFPDDGVYRNRNEGWLIIWRIFMLNEEMFCWFRFSFLEDRIITRVEVMENDTAIKCCGLGGRWGEEITNCRCRYLQRLHHRHHLHHQRNRRRRLDRSHHHKSQPYQVSTLRQVL